MKNKIISLVLSICILSSCSDFLDRDAKTGLSGDLVWVNQENAVFGVNAIYRSNRDFTNELVIQGMMDDYTDISYQSWATGLTTGGFLVTAALYRDGWSMFYGGIYRANLAIKNIPGIEFKNAQLKERLMGESKFLRGYYYFRLWDLYGGIPIYDTPMHFSEAYKPRNTEQEVYEFIVRDMTDAYATLPDSYGKEDKGRATKWAALAVRGKAHLWAKQYDKAAADFKELIENSDRKLLADYHLLFRVDGNNNEEVIFDVQYTDLSGHGVATDLNYGNAMGETKGSQRTRPTNKLVESYEVIYTDASGVVKAKPFNYSDYKTNDGSVFNPTIAKHWQEKETVVKIFSDRDKRLEKSIVTPWSTFVGKGGVSYIYKLPVPAGADPEAYKPVFVDNYAWRKFVETGSKYSLAANMPQNIPLIRLADVKLMYAEAQNEAKGPDASVYTEVNSVRARAGLPGLDEGLSKDQMREKIIHERMVEFAGEGQRYSDIRRWKIAKSVVDKVWMTDIYGKNIRQRGFPDKYYLWPIPNIEMNVNENLVQNPGW